ncbi:MAG: RING finger protein [Candidatus Promineifilaceae bacterium]
MTLLTMADEEVGQLIQITETDIVEANRLSLSCPICAGAVEKYVDDVSLSPVVCMQCGTLYHKACWEQHNGKCAVLGCEHKEARPYGTDIGTRVVINYSDLPKHVPVRPSYNGRTQQLKEQEKQRQKESSFWNILFDRIRRAFGWRD